MDEAYFNMIKERQLIKQKERENKLTLLSHDDYKYGGSYEYDSDNLSIMCRNDDKLRRWRKEIERDIEIKYHRALKDKIDDVEWKYKEVIKFMRKENEKLKKELLKYKQNV